MPNDVFCVKFKIFKQRPDNPLGKNIPEEKITQSAVVSDAAADADTTTSP